MPTPPESSRGEKRPSNPNSGSDNNSDTSSETKGREKTGIYNTKNKRQKIMKREIEARVISHNIIQEKINSRPSSPSRETHSPKDNSLTLDAEEFMALGGTSSTFLYNELQNTEAVSPLHAPHAEASSSSKLESAVNTEIVTSLNTSEYNDTSSQTQTEKLSDEQITLEMQKIFEQDLKVIGILKDTTKPALTEEKIKLGRLKRLVAAGGCTVGRHGCPEGSIIDNLENIKRELVKFKNLPSGEKKKRIPEWKRKESEIVAVCITETLSSLKFSTRKVDQKYSVQADVPPNKLEHALQFLQNYHDVTKVNELRKKVLPRFGIENLTSTGGSSSSTYASRQQ